MSSWSRLKAAPTIAAVLVGEQAGEPFVPVMAEPGVNGVGIAAAEQTGGSWEEPVVVSSPAQTEWAPIAGL